MTFRLDRRRLCIFPACLFLLPVFFHQLLNYHQLVDSSTTIPLRQQQVVLQHSTTTPPPLPQSLVAICFTGLTRSLRNYTHESIRNYLFKRLTQQNFSYHVFVHTYLVDFIKNPRAGEINVPMDRSEWTLLEPVRFEVENQSQVDLNLNYEEVKRYGNLWNDDPSGHPSKTF